MISFESIMGPLSAALGLSFFIERFLELFKNFLEPLIGKRKSCKIPPVSKAKKIIKDLEKTKKDDIGSQETEKNAEGIKTKLAQELDPSKQKALKEELITLEKDGEWGEQFSNSTILVEKASDPDDGRTLKAFILQVLGFAIGILIARLSGLRLFGSFFSDSTTISPGFDYLLTGLLIGGGSRPIHVLIRFITQRKMTVRAKQPPAEEDEKPLYTAKKEAPAIVTPISDTTADEWIDIPYNGGIDRDKLEWVHKRKKNPNQIVYHHTAMNSRSTFEDVVRVIKNRTDSKGNHWVTGYNCVICTEGSIHPFCRWDRYGNHAAGHNLRSLGLTFNGNYETDRSVPFSNPDGKMGLSRPTEAQLKSAARVVTLWTFLYPIAVDFDKLIIPHNAISNKTCPGSNFPFDEFREWIKLYRKKWETSTAIQDRIQTFKLKPFLYV